MPRMKAVLAGVLLVSLLLMIATAVHQFSKPTQSRGERRIRTALARIKAENEGGEEETGVHDALYTRAVTLAQKLLRRSNKNGANNAGICGGGV
jgi:hypothetical protein